MRKPRIHKLIKPIISNGVYIIKSIYNYVRVNAISEYPLHTNTTDATDKLLALRVNSVKFLHSINPSLRTPPPQRMRGKTSFRLAHGRL